MQIQSFAQFLIGIVMAFTYSWKMALISLIIVPLFSIILGGMIKSIRHHAQMKFKYVADSITIAEETLSSIRNCSLI
jgi:ABC-type multidrug transport system fused ATPase/permease subunit